jgi:hypothetical protein
MKLILLIIGIYILYRFIFGFVLPVAGAARQMNRKVKEFREQQTEAIRQQTNNSSYTNSNNNYKTPTEDYLEFEEIK